ncbi:MAG TPA: GTPase Era [Cyclobacteriaceae bacterium]|nr:GTPase Era [Cyclobacteriaceae bacterium]
MDGDQHKAGFVSIIGKPNVGKSTLMNRLAGEKISIITPKAQTTRHRILGILNLEDFQIVFSDTPGIIRPEYVLHKNMMQFVRASLEDSDIILFMAEINQGYDPQEIKSLFGHTAAKIIFILNKTDQANKAEIERDLLSWENAWNFDAMFSISALKGEGTEEIFEKIMELLPVHPPYFPKDQITDRPERFFASEIVREKIFLNYAKEIPYSTEVVITDFREDENIIRMRVEIYVERESQKGILIGKGGEALKNVGIQARKDLELFFGKQVYLEQRVKVEKDWRKRKDKLARFGY